MSDPIPPALPPRTRRHPIVVVLMILGGVILLLPGVCALGFMGAMASSSGGADGFLLLWLICFAIAAGGVAMIVSAIKGPKY